MASFQNCLADMLIYADTGSHEQFEDKRFTLMWAFTHEDKETRNGIRQSRRGGKGRREAGGLPGVHRGRSREGALKGNLRVEDL